MYKFYQNYLSPSADLNARTLLHAILSSTSFRLAATMAMVYCFSTVIRGVFRCRNPAYQQFIRTFKTATALSDHHLDLQKKDDDFTKAVVEARTKLRQTYDYDFSKWPVDFKWSDGVFAKDRVPTLIPLDQSGANNEGPLVRAVSWLMAHSIGRIMLYPGLSNSEMCELSHCITLFYLGSIGLLQSVLSNALETGRHFLIESHQGRRYKLEARDGNHIDSIFVDRRRSDTQSNYKGSRTIIVCPFSNVFSFRKLSGHLR